MKFKYYNSYQIPHYDGEYYWSISPFSGSLTRSKIKRFQHRAVPEKVAKNLEAIYYPFQCEPPQQINPTTSDAINKKLLRFSQIFSKIGNKRFYLTKIFSATKEFLFSSTGEACSAIHKIDFHREKYFELCLERAFLSAKVSKSFEKNGVIFIGAFLPTGDMHCWIMEDGNPVDFHDRGWINYRPLIAFYNS